MCLSGISFLPLRNIMSASEFESVALRFKQRYSEKYARSAAPGLKEQWDVRLQNFLENECGNCEILFFPLYYGGSEDFDF